MPSYTGEGYDPVEAVPESLNLSSTVPLAIKSYIKRFPCIQSPNQYANGPGQEIIVPIDTSTPGAFLDTANSYIKFDFNVINTSPFVDYCDFGPGGLSAVFNKFAIKSQNTPIEEIQSYNTIHAQIMEIGGESMEEFQMFQSRRSCTVPGGFSSSSRNHVNLAKKPMIDLSGKIMHGSTSYNTSSIDGWQVKSSYVGTVSAQASISASFNVERGEMFNDGMKFNSNPDSMNPHLWPDFIGVEPLHQSDHISKKNSNRLQDYSTYLCNVKNIPIGMRSKVVRDTAANRYVRTRATNAVVYNECSELDNGVFTYTAVMPFVSGVLGEMMTKMIPTMILKDLTMHWYTADPGEVFKLSMDPCRRLVGTRRDYCVYYGNQLGPISGVTTWPGSDANVLDGTNNFGPSSKIFSYWPAVTTDKPIAAAAAATGGSAATDYKGIEVAYAANNIAANADQRISAAGTWPFYPFNNTTRIFANTDNGSAPIELSYFAGGGVPQYWIPNSEAQITGEPIAGRTGLAYTLSGLPNGTTYLSLGNIGNDGYGCYGTYLPASEAQTKRTMYNYFKLNDTVLQDHNNTAINYPKSFKGHYGGNQSYGVTYTITNFQYICQQIIVPANITSDIVMMATRGAVMIDSNTVKVYPQLQAAPGSSSQNIIVPAKIALANTIGFIFRSSEQLSRGPKQFMYDSFCGYNPLASKILHHDSNSYNGTNLPPSIVDISCSTSAPAASSTGFSYQLQIGGDTVPQQPITSAMEIFAENEKATHALFEKTNNMNMVGNVHFGRGTVDVPKGLTDYAGSKPDAAVFDTSKHGSFWCVWHDPEFLADQTLVNNTNMRYLTAMSENYDTYGVAPVVASDSWDRMMSSTNWTPVPIGRYMWPMFKTPDGRFKLLFELDSFSKMSHVAQSGRYLGTNTVSLKCEGFNWFSQSVQNDIPVNVVTTAYVMCAMHLQCEAGGVLRSFI